MTNTEVWGITAGAIVFFVILGLLVLIRLIGKNSQIRFGFFIEHDRSGSDEEDTWVKPPKTGV
jgi:hypothetical protein